MDPACEIQGRRLLADIHLALLQYQGVTQFTHIIKIFPFAINTINQCSMNIVIIMLHAPTEPI